MNGHLSRSKPRDQAATDASDACHGIPAHHVGLHLRPPRAVHARARDPAPERGLHAGGTAVPVARHQERNRAAVEHAAEQGLDARGCLVAQSSAPPAHEPRLGIPLQADGGREGLDDPSPEEVGSPRAQHTPHDALVSTHCRAVLLVQAPHVVAPRALQNRGGVVRELRVAERQHPGGQRRAGGARVWGLRRPGSWFCHRERFAPLWLRLRAQQRGARCDAASRVQQAG
mmetsp:Transcript_10810/g.34406  ORF Transcript_10810/g.34406 Transcript_10810/m.34406 type:complete len:229 (-) Transcript_10810:478-1164(-)